MKFLINLIVCCFCLSAIGQPLDSVHTGNKRLRNLGIASVGLYAGALYGLDRLWYSDSGRQSFRFFNDNAEWNQVDKLGHFYSAFYLSHGSEKMLSWAGLEKPKSYIIGAATGFLLLLPIEIFDGHSEAYGASAGDLVANAAGAGFFLIQTALWDQPRIYPKFSFHQTRFSPIRPGVLGDNLAAEILKDYNGQTYWLTFDVDKFVRFPVWLDVSVGYGAEEMVYARRETNLEAGFQDYRQFYLAPDLDLRAFKGRSKAINTLLDIGSILKFPAPTLEFSKGKASFHWLYF